MFTAKHIAVYFFYENKTPRNAGRVQN